MGMTMKNYADLPLPEAGSLTKVADGIFWLRMTLPFDLDHINLYLIEDTDGIYVIDTGLGTDTTRTHWEAIFSQLDKPVKAVIVTHMHPDHIGLAGWITEKFRVPFYMTRTEYFASRALFGGANGADNWTDRAYFTAMGMAKEQVERAVSGNKGLSAVVSPIPLSYRRLSHGLVLPINGEHWEVLIGSGHSPEHACLYCQERQILIAGDQVLPAISPNIGAYSTEPDVNSLDDYLKSLSMLMQLPASTLVLPAHNQPFYELHNRLAALRQHHQQHLDALVEACREEQTVVSCLPVLFKRELSGRNIFFAVAECLSHLNYLRYENYIERRLDENGVWRFRSIDCEQIDGGEPDMDFLSV